MDAKEWLRVLGLAAVLFGCGFEVSHFIGWIRIGDEFHLIVTAPIVVGGAILFLVMFNSLDDAKRTAPKKVEEKGPPAALGKKHEKDAPKQHEENIRRAALKKLHDEIVPLAALPIASEPQIRSFEVRLPKIDKYRSGQTLTLKKANGGMWTDTSRRRKYSDEAVDLFIRKGILEEKTGQPN